jgi:N-acetylglucosamine kinase-like BadF-type ATPase
MTDRTQLAIGRNAISVPKITKRLLQMAAAVIATAAVSLAVIVLNNVLTGKGGLVQGLNAWTAFIQRPDILGTMALTAVVTVATVYWQRSGERK